MNLLELMLKEEVEWPVAAKFAAQDGDDSRVYFYVVIPTKSDLSDRYWITKDVSYAGRSKLSGLGDDWSTRIITREEYQAAGGRMKLECKAENAATSKQSAPKGSGNPILGMVLADLTNRALEGKEKYGEPLKAHNGSNALWDAYQEALDLAMYLRQLIEEQQDA